MIDFLLAPAVFSGSLVFALSGLAVNFSDNSLTLHCSQMLPACVSLPHALHFRPPPFLLAISSLPLLIR
jgi:hypothetical protein